MSNPPTQAVTDVPEFITDLDGGQFDRALSIALSEVSAAVVDNDRVGEVSITMKIKPVLKGTHQVRIEHALKFNRPTMDGKKSEEVTRSTIMHVGQYGKLSLAQPSLLEESRQQKFPEPGDTRTQPR